MKISEMFVGQFVEMHGETSNHRYKTCGHVVGLGLAYETQTIASTRSDQEIPVLPLVHFVGESFPRTVHPSNLQKFKD
jgi:hypothetical protein